MPALYSSLESSGLGYFRFCVSPPKVQRTKTTRPTNSINSHFHGDFCIPRVFTYHRLTLKMHRYVWIHVDQKLGSLVEVLVPWSGHFAHETLTFDPMIRFVSLLFQTSLMSISKLYVTSESRFECPEQS